MRLSVFLGYITMTYRKFDTSTWQDTWFEQLDPHGKLSFIYLWSNDYCSQSGIYQISPKRFEFDTGLKMNGIVDNLFPKVEWFKDKSTIWVKCFFKHQCQSSNFAKSALNGLRHDMVLLSAFIEHNKTILNGYDNIDLGKYHNKSDNTI